MYIYKKYVYVHFLLQPRILTISKGICSYVAYSIYLILSRYWFFFFSQVILIILFVVLSVYYVFIG